MHHRHHQKITPAPLGQRIVSSARGLACSTFSGVAGIERELRDVRGVSKQDATARLTNSRKGVDLSCRNDRRRDGGKRRVGGEEEGSESFRTVQTGSSFGAEEMEARSSGLELGSWLEVDGIEARSTTWDVSEEERKTKKLEREDVPEESRLEQEWAWLTAVHRLNQIQKHLHTTFTIPTSSLQQPRNHTIDLSKPTTDTRPPNQYLHHIQPYLSPTYHNIFPPLPQHPVPLPSHHHPPQHWTRQQPHPPIKQPPSPKTYTFCPYIQCHTTLRPSATHSSKRVILASQTRSCIHLCCDFVSSTADEWTSHAWQAHSVPPTPSPSTPAPTRTRDDKGGRSPAAVVLSTSFRPSLSSSPRRVRTTWGTQQDPSHSNHLLQQREQSETKAALNEAAYPPTTCLRCQSQKLEACYDGADGPCTMCLECGRHVGLFSLIGGRVGAVTPCP